MLHELEITPEYLNPPPSRPQKNLTLQATKSAADSELAIRRISETCNIVNFGIRNFRADQQVS